MKNHISTLFLCIGVGAGMAFAMPAVAQNGEKTKSTSAHHAKKPVAKKHAAKVEEKKDDNKDEDGKEIDLAGSSTVEYHCDLGNKVTIYENNADEKHIALRWDKHLHRLASVDTTTGAHRFENNKVGLVWIGIPAKGMLLDSKHGHQLANECKNAAQSSAGPTSNTVGSLLKSDPNTVSSASAKKAAVAETANK